MATPNKSLVVVTWDGQSRPLNYIYQDAVPAFDFLVFDYSGKGDTSQLAAMAPKHFLSVATECKGQIITALYNYLLPLNAQDAYQYIGIFDDDQYISVSAINQLLFIADLEHLDVFQPSLAHDSYYDNRQFINKPGYQILKADWVEVMCPFYRMDIFNAFAPHCVENISGTGVDLYLVPTIQYLMGKTNTAVVHAVQVKHMRPVRTGARVFSNGKTAVKEIQIMQALSKTLLLQKNTLVSTDLAYQKIWQHLNKDSKGEITIVDKLSRVVPLFKNIYRMLVDASYR
ncbi:MAG: hypothetical protein ACKOWO_09520 [Sediminibacterium sp.]